MQYLGGKQRIARQLVEFIQPFIKKSYVEPFVGGAAVMARIRASTRIGADANLALITMWSALANGWMPSENISEAKYAKIRIKADPYDPLTAFVAIGCSFGGIWWGGYAKNSRGDNYARAAARSLARKMKTLENVKWRHADYRELKYPIGSVIYCDPPYRGTTPYAGAPKNFDYNSFWQFCRNKKNEGHVVFISEYSAPSDFVTVLKIKTIKSIRPDCNSTPSIEKLFTPGKG